jgi:hypothetical protein
MLLGLFCFGRSRGIVEGFAGERKCIIMGWKGLVLSWYSSTLQRRSEIIAVHGTALLSQFGLIKAGQAPVV